MVFCKVFKNQAHVYKMEKNVSHKFHLYQIKNKQIFHEYNSNM